MSVLSQELLRKALNNSSAEPQASSRPQKHFQELLRTKSCNEKPREKDFFSLLADEEEEEEENATAVPSAEPRPALAHALAAFTPCSAVDASAPAAAALQQQPPPGMEALFEKMASCMIVMNASHEVETTLFLDNAHFATSSLFGTQITIREFSTAPKAFNIEILSNPLALEMINAGRNDLLAAFQRGGFNFTVHRLDTHLEQGEQRPVFHRKESGDKEQRDEQGDRS